MRVMMLSREIRRVPLDYDPPYRDRHGYWPVFDRFYDDALAKWQEEKRRWDAGERPSYFKSEDEGMSFEEYHGEAPDPDYYYSGSAWPEDAEMAIRMYESVSEGKRARHPEHRGHVRLLARGVARGHRRAGRRHEHRHG
jgi:hypothetical protein